MQQKLADVERKGGSLCVRLKEGSAFDPYIYEQIRMDETCLPPLQERKGVIRYETAGLTSLSYFLAHYLLQFLCSDAQFGQHRGRYATLFFKQSQQYMFGSNIGVTHLLGAFNSKV